MRIKRILTMMAAMLLVMGALAQSNNKLLKSNKKARKVMAVYDGTSRFYQDACPYIRPVGYSVYTLRGTKMKEDFGQILGINATIFDEHFEVEPVRDSQQDFQQYEEDESGNFVARTNDKYIGYLTIYENGDLSWKIGDYDVQKLYEKWNQETYRNTQKTYDLSVAFKFEDIHGSQSHYDDIFVVFTTKITFKPFSVVPINVKVDWDNYKNNSYWYTKNTTDIGTDELHITVPTMESNLREDANQLDFLFSDAFYNNQIVSRSIITGETGFSYNNCKYRLVFDEANIGKKFKGADGKTYTLSVSADGRELKVNNVVIAKLVLPAKFADKAGDMEEANYTMIEYQHNKIAHALLNYCSHKEFDAKNDAVLNNFLNVIISLAIQNEDVCKPLDVEKTTFNVRFIRPIDVSEPHIMLLPDIPGDNTNTIYLNRIFDYSDWRGLWSNSYFDYYGVMTPKIDGLTDGELLSVNHSVKADLNGAGMKPMYQISSQLDFTYHEDPFLGNYIEYNNTGTNIQSLKLEIPVIVEYIWGEFYTIVTVTMGAQDLLLNATNFPDANFRKALASKLRIGEGDEITDEMISATTSLDVSKSSNTPTEEKIADLTGIEHFTALKTLNCYRNQLTALDVSKNTALEQLWCFNNQLTTLDLSKNTALTKLYCHANQLTSLDVSKNTALTVLECDNNQLTALDVSKNTALTYLYCDNNQLTALDVSKNTTLTELYCYNNQLTALDVSKNTALIRLYCSDNQLTALDVSQNTALKYLYCSDNQLTALDVSKNTALTDLYCYNNQLTSLDVSKNTALTELYCYNNQLTSLDVSKNTKLTWLRCYGNQLTSLDVSKNTALTHLWCFSNQIKGEAMDALVASLPAVEWGEFIVINTNDENEGNVCTKSQVAVAKGKGWKVYDYNGGVYDENYEYPEYEGSEDPEQEIDPVDEDDNVDFGNDMDENSDLNGTVIRDIYYNIGDGNGEYNADEGCIVIKKTTDDGTVDELEGKDIFGEDFKSQFTGIVFKVPAGKGTIKVDAETTGNMLLKVKIGSNDPVEMELNGKLKVTFPYNVSEATYVYIYAGAANEAKGFGKASATDAALKIYGIEFLRDDTPTDIDRPIPDPSLNGGESWYTIDGKKLNGEPTKPGLYIRNGKKVVK